VIAFAFLSLAQNRPTDAVDFTISDTEGNYYNLFEQFEQGKVVVLYFFSTSCGSCYLEAPVLDTVYENYGLGEQDVLVWGIAYPGATDEQIDIFQDSTNVRFPCLSTAHSTNVFALYDVGYTPQTHVTCNFMASGKIAYQDLDYYIQGCFTTNDKNINNNHDISIVSHQSYIRKWKS